MNEPDPYYPTITSTGNITTLDTPKPRRRKQPLGFAPPRPTPRPKKRK